MTLGFVVIDKPEGITSHDVVDRIRRRWKVDKAGHLGTLDPAATGVLPLAIGKATRLARFVPSDPKEYVGEIRLGWETTTGDAEGEPLGEPRAVTVGEPEIAAAMQSFLGEIEQVPPAYSAKKISGTAAYRLARAGTPVDLAPEKVRIEEFLLLGADLPRVSFRVSCSAGTYVRALARDLGRALETGAHLAALRRVRSGPFHIGQARKLEEAEPDDVIPAEAALGHLPEFHADPEQEERVGHGQRIECREGDSPVRIFNKKGQLIAIGIVENGWAYPRVVLV